MNPFEARAQGMTAEYNIEIETRYHPRAVLLPVWYEGRSYMEKRMREEAELAPKSAKLRLIRRYVTAPEVIAE